MAGKIRTYRDLDIWKTSIQLVKDVYKLTEQFPKQEVYGLVSQMRRAGVSIPYKCSRRFQAISQQGVQAVFVHIVRKLRRIGNAGDNSERACVHF